LIESCLAIVACSISLFESLNHGLDGSNRASIEADQALSRRAVQRRGRAHMIDLLLLGAGFLILLTGGELLVRGAVRVAEYAGMSPLLIGLTLVGFGTSAPELVTSVQAAMQGSPGIAVGNIVGSNIANIMLILGISAAIRPMAVGTAAFQRDGMIVLASALLFNVVGLTAPLGRPVGAVLFALLISYLWYAYRQERSGAHIEGHTAAYERAEAIEELLSDKAERDRRRRWPPIRIDIVTALLTAIGGMLLVIAGGRLLVDSAVAIARTYHVSEAVIGLTIISIGTSMPELATSAVAAYRKHADVALGNIMGSNIYNTFGIGGATGLLSPTIIPSEIVRYDNLVMLGASMAMLAFARSGYRLSRQEGLVLLSGYAVYLYTLFPK